MIQHNKTNSTIYHNTPIAFEVNKESKDSYSINSFYNHNFETNEITHEHEVIKNYYYNEIPKIGKIDNKKYKETIFKGSLKECYLFIINIVKLEGHYIQDPNKSFNKLFIKPIK